MTEMKKITVDELKKLANKKGSQRKNAQRALTEIERCQGRGIKEISLNNENRSIEITYLNMAVSVFTVNNRVGC